MYCPSCDKTYGAIHSRCPECHSWLKVSAPASQRARSAASSGSLSGDSTPTSPNPSSAVSTLDRDSGISWADPAPNAGSLGSSWDDEPDNAWSDASSSSPSSSSSSGGWGGGDDWGGGSSGTESSVDSGWGGSPASSPAQAPPPASKSSGWLGGDEAQDGWSTGGLGGSSSPKAQAPAPQAESGRGWLGDPQPSSGSLEQEQEPGWLGAGSAPAKAEPSSGQGWLGEGSGGSSYDSGSGGGNGWLGEDSHGSSVPSMTEMVDQAIHDESDEDFVDDSWVDEEIRDSEFDELEIPEIIPPAPEIGGLALKMVLVAVLVLLVGGGIFFMKKDSKTPEQLEAERIEKRAAFAQAAIDGGKEDLANGRAQLAIPQFQEAMVALSEVGATQKEIDDAEILLSQALMGSKEYKEAIEHWKTLKKSEDPETAKAAKSGLDQAARELRIEANGELKQAKVYADKGESTSVLSRGRLALDVYKEYGGSAAQKGDAHGVIGRSYLNGRNYGSARDHLKKAVALAPNLGYQKYLKQVNAELQPRYTAPVRSKRPKTRRPSSKPSFDIDGPNYKTNNRRYSKKRRKGRSSSGGSAAPSGKKRKMKEIPIYQKKSRSKGGNRRGSKGVLQSY